MDEGLHSHLHVQEPWYQHVCMGWVHPELCIDHMLYNWPKAPCDGKFGFEWSWSCFVDVLWIPSHHHHTCHLSNMTEGDFSVLVRNSAECHENPTSLDFYKYVCPYLQCRVILILPTPCREIPVILLRGRYLIMGIRGAVQEWVLIDKMQKGSIVILSTVMVMVAFDVL